MVVGHDTTSALDLPVAGALPMALGFVTPAFALAGVALLSVPIIIHLLNRRRYRIQDWAAMQFLLAAMRKNRRRIQFEQWLLLAMRCAVIFLAALALARPMGCGESSLARLVGDSAAMHVIVIDNSYSMAYEADRPDAKTHLDQAKRLARELVERLNPGSESVVLITAGQPARAVIARPSYDLADVVRAIDRIEQTAGGTDLPGALQLADQVAGENASHPAKVLHLFTDATTSAWRNGHETPIATLGKKLGDQYRVRHYSLAVPNQANAAVTNVEPTAGLVRTRFYNAFAATAYAYGGSIESSVLWKLDDQSLPGGASVTLNLQETKVLQDSVNVQRGGPSVITAQLSADDRLKLDNARYRTIDVASEMKILLVEGRRGMTPLEGSAAFLELALAPPAEASNNAAGRSTASYVKPERISDIELSGRVLGEYRAVMISDVAQISAPVADQLQRYVQQGGTVVWFMGEQVQRENYNSTLVPRGLLPGPLAQRQTGNEFTFLFNPTGNNHPLLGAFANLENSGLGTARVFTYWQVSPKPELRVERVLTFAGKGASTQPTARDIESNDPAITLHQLGDGRVVFFASSADAEWTSFPVKPAYVALIHEIVVGTVAGSERWMNLEVGQRVQVPATLSLNGLPVLRETQRGAEQPLEQVMRSDGTSVWQSAPLTQPGVYRLVAGDLSIPVSVNVPADEADIRPLANEAIKTALGDIEVETFAAELPGVDGSGEDGNDFGWSIMAIVLVLLGAECLLAMRFGHYRR